MKPNIRTKTLKTFAAILTKYRLFGKELLPDAL